MTYKRNPDADPIASALGQRTSAKKAESSAKNGRKGGPLRQFEVFRAGWIAARRTPLSDTPALDISDAYCDWHKTSRQTDEREE